MEDQTPRIQDKFAKANREIEAKINQVTIQSLQAQRGVSAGPVASTKPKQMTRDNRCGSENYVGQSTNAQ